MMAGFQDKVIQHLRFAKNWLDRAEEEYSKEQILEAELTLSLAEAEVRHAWETSRGSEVSATLRVVKRWRWRIVVGLAAVGLVWGALYFVNNREPDYPDPSFSMGQPVVPGRWENPIEYQVVFNVPEPVTTVPAEQPAPREAAPVRTVAPAAQVEQVIVSESAPLKIEPVELAEQKAEMTTELESEPETDSAQQTEPLTVETSVAQDLPTEPDDDDQAPVDPPQLNLGQLFKIANDALKGE